MLAMWFQAMKNGVSLQACGLDERQRSLLPAPQDSRNLSTFEPRGPLAKNCPLGRCFLTLNSLLNLLIGRPISLRP